MWAADETFDDTGALAGGDGLVPGRRMITDRLPVQLKGLEGAPGPAVLHLEFTPRGNEVWVSVRDADRIDVYDTATFAKKAEIPAQKPSGIFFTARATRIGQ